jgi:hypothetical protein
VSHEVDTTWNVPSDEISRTVTSKVPHHRSNTIIFSSFDFHSPYAREAAVGSLMILSTLSPAISPAALVAFL